MGERKGEACAADGRLMVGPVPPAVHVSWRWLLLPHERWIARLVSNRFQRTGLVNPAQLRLVAKHGTIGLVLLCVAASTAAVFGVVGVLGIALLFASAGAHFAYVTLAVCIIGELYSMARLLQILPTKPDQADLDFLGRAPPRASDGR